jgi:hypothetical protein
MHSFPARRWTVVSSLLSSAELEWNSSWSVIVAVEKRKVVCAFQAQRLFHGQLGYDHLQALVLIIFATGQHGPGYTSQFGWRSRLRLCCAAHTESTGALISILLIQAFHGGAAS